MKYVRILLSGLLVCALWSALALYGGLLGWWISPPAASDDTAGFIEVARAMIEAASPGSVAFVLIEDGAIREEVYRSVSGEVGPDTVFPTASMSKWPAAYGVMLLVQAGKLELNAPVSRYLTRWQLPAGEFDNDGVTIQRLLSHTAGLVDGLGFGDFGAEESLPTLEASLADPRGSDDEDNRIVVGREPGSEWAYSGGGYLVLELLVEEVSGQAFADYMQTAVFEPLGMNRSGYEYLGTQDDISGSYDRQGEPAPLYRYESKAATALIASPADLVRFAQAQLDASAPLGAELTAAMREPHGKQLGMAIWGLGTMLYSPAGSGDYLFGHDGANDPSINSTVRVNPVTGDAIVALSTGPAYLASRIAYQWGLWQTGYPDFIQTNLAIDSAMLPLLIGVCLIVLVTLGLLVRARRKRRA